MAADGCTVIQTRHRDTHQTTPACGPSHFGRRSPSAGSRPGHKPLLLLPAWWVLCRPPLERGRSGIWWEGCCLLRSARGAERQGAGVRGRPFRTHMPATAAATGAVLAKVCDVPTCAALHNHWDICRHHHRARGGLALCIHPQRACGLCRYFDAASERGLRGAGAGDLQLLASHAAAGCSKEQVHASQRCSS